MKFESLMAIFTMPAFAFQGLGLPFVVLSALVIVIGLLCYGYRQRRFYRNLPGPPHSWLFGHIKVISEIAALMPPNCHPQLYYTEITRRHNIDGIFYLDLWPIGPGTVIITDPKLIEQAPLPRPLPVHPMAGVFMKPMWGEGTIAATSGPLWKKLHTAMSPAFSWTHVRGLTGLMIDESILFKRKLDELSFTGEIFSMEELVAKFIFGIVSMVTLGIPLHAQTAGSQDLDDLRELVNLAREESDVRVAYNLIVQIPRRWRRRQVLNRLEPSLLNKIYDRLEWLLREGVVPSRKNTTSILDLLLREYVEAFTLKQDKVQHSLLRLSGTDECVLLSNIKLLLSGGHNTSTNTLNFIFMLLSKAPDVVEKMHQEYIEQLGNTPQDTILNNPEILHKLLYTESVIKESLRLSPPGSDLRRGPPGATVTTHDGRRLPIDNNLVVTTNAHSIHHDPRIYPEPTVFRPERWLGPDKMPPAPGYFRPFGGDGRTCPGQNMGMNMVKIALVMTVGDFVFECAGLKPNAEPRTLHTDLDLMFGDIAFQELGSEGRPREGMMMRVRKKAGGPKS